MDRDSGLKWLLLLVIFLGQLLFISSVYAEWTSVNPPTVSSNWELLGLRAFWVVGQDNANKKGVLLHFVNGSWTVLEAPNVSSDWGLAAIDFASAYEGWAVGQDVANGRGALLHYTNGAWTSVEPPGEIGSDWGLSAVDSISSNGGWMAGQDFANKRGLLLHYENVLVTLPALSTTTVSEITTTTATSGGTINSDGGAPVTARGVCWNTILNPVVGSNCTSDGTGTGTFTSSITGLTPGTAYHVRAYATNSVGTGYGNDVVFKTSVGSVLPALTTTAVSAVTSTTAISGGTITLAGVTPVTSWGVCWNTVLNPVVGGTCTNESTGTSPGTFPFTFTSFITGLTPSTAYHVRAYASNSVGTGYGNDVTFLTTVSGQVALATATPSHGTASAAPVTRLVLTPATLPDVSSDWGLSGVHQGWAVGQDNQNKRGVLLHSVNGSWISVVPPEVSSDWGLSGVDLISSIEGWAVGQDNENKRGVLLHFINGSWISVEPPDISSDWGLSGVNLISSIEGWAAGQDNENKRGVLLHFVNGLWTPVELPDVSSDWGLSAVDVISSNQGWAVGQTSDGQNVTGALLQYTVPLISASPVAVNYHDVEVGAYSDQTVVVKNAGNGDLVIGAITSPSSPFAIQADGCSGVTLPSLQACGVTYRFLPDSEGAFSDSSTIPSNGNEVTVTLTGSGTGTSNYISLLNPPEGETFTVCPDYASPLFQWDSGGTFNSIELQFSLTADFSKIPARVKGNPDVNEVILRSGTWKKVLLLPGADGGGIYWTVIGTKRDRTTVEGDVFSFQVAGAEPVANPEISQTSKTALPPPTLSWENRCNTKFKAWFGNSADLQKPGAKKIAFSFAVKDPNENQGIFAKELTSNQWASIRRLGGDVTGAVLYWYVESADALGRQKKTDVMTFTLTD